MMISHLVTSLALASSLAGDAPAPVAFADLNLKITPPALEELAHDPSIKGQIRSMWEGKLGVSSVEIALIVLPAKDFDLVEPEDVTDVLLFNLRDPKKGNPDFGWDSQELVPGAFGFTPYASLAIGTWREGTNPKSRTFMLSSLTKDSGWVVRVDVEPDPGEAATKTVLDFLKKGVAYDGPKRDWKWSDAEAKARWEADAPAETHKKFDGAIRTDHYLILTNSSGGKAFAKKMEECYTAIRKVYPFDDVPGRMLMPVFLFRTPEEYYAFCTTAVKWSLEQAKQSKGHASRDYYATWYEAPNDPVHIHEATHQIFGNRLRLSGGGSWFQEGVAELMEGNPNDRNVAARDVKKGKHTPLEQFMVVPSLIATKEDVSGGGGAADAYNQAGLLIEFLHDSKWGKDKFQQFIHTMGLVPRGRLPAIEAAVQKVYGVDVAGLEAQFIEYCKKR